MGTSPEICPVCGEAVPERARACPGCGADERTGWSEEARYHELGLPDEEFDYDDFVQREFHGQAPRRRNARLWWWVAVGALALFLWGFLGRFF